MRKMIQKSCTDCLKLKMLVGPKGVVECRDGYWKMTTKHTERDFREFARRAMGCLGWTYRAET